MSIILNIYDPGLNNKIELLPIGHKVENFTLHLSSGRQIELTQILKNGPLVLVFIRGTWCPFCRIHLGKLRKWVDQSKNKNSTLVVVSTEQPFVIQEWLKENPVTYLFASDSTFRLATYFKVHINPNDFSNAATFVIDTDQTIKLAYKGKRTKKNLDQIEASIN